MSKRIEVNDLNVYYSKFMAVEDVTLTIEPRTVTAFIGPSGCGKSTFLRTLNRMHEVIPGARVEGEVLHRRQQPLRRRASTRCSCAARSAWCSSGPNPFPTMSIRDNVLAGVKLNNRRMSKTDAGRPGREVAAGRQPLERGQGPPRQARLRPLRRPAAASLHRPRHRGLARRHPDGRAVLGPRPDLDPRDRGPHRGAQARVHDRHRDPQHAAGVAASPTAPRSSTSPGTGKPGKLIEYDDTTTIFSKPSVQATEDYVSGRFG